MSKFKKGDTPNPNGRNGALAYIINKVFDEEVDEKTKKELMIRKVYRMAMNGSLGAVTYLSDRTEGKAKETKEITHKDTLIIE